MSSAKSHFGQDSHRQDKNTQDVGGDDKDIPEIKGCLLSSQDGATGPPSLPWQILYPPGHPMNSFVGGCADC